MLHLQVGCIYLGKKQNDDGWIYGALDNCTNLAQPYGLMHETYLHKISWGGVCNTEKVGTETRCLFEGKNIIHQAASFLEKEICVFS